MLGMIGPMPRFVDRRYWLENCGNMYLLDIFDPKAFEVFISIANPYDRRLMVQRLPDETVFFSYVHSSVVLAGNVEIGKGTVIQAGSVISHGANIGNHVIINYNAVIGHDAQIGDYCTIAPLAGIMGNCVIGDQVEIGASAQVKPNVKVCNNVTIGMCAAVVKDINEPGTYVGIPAKRISGD
jgi:sugar O-acyltransferase (sialic acid O-acetyltransferase NeuD family)